MIVDKGSSEKNFKIIDFGLIEITPYQNINKLQVAEYQAPELYFGHPYDTKVDVWCLGVTIIEALLGHAAFGVGCPDNDEKMESQVVSHVMQ